MIEVTTKKGKNQKPTPGSALGKCARNYGRAIILNTQKTGVCEMKPKNPTAENKYTYEPTEFGAQFPTRFLKQIARSWGCCRNLKSDDEGKLQREFTCKTRGCTACNSMRSAKFTEKFSPVIARLLANAEKTQLDEASKLVGKAPQIYLVSLTVKNPTLEELSASIDKMKADWRLIYNEAKKKASYRQNFTGFRKFEIHPTEPNVAKLRGALAHAKKKRQTLKIPGIKKRLERAEAGIWEFHPHYHFLILGKGNAEWLKRQWLRLNILADKRCQDVRKVEADKVTGAVLEIAKYIFKPGEKADEFTPSIPYTEKVLQTLCKMMGTRTVSAFGGITQLVRELEDEKAGELLKAGKTHEELEKQAWEGKEWMEEQERKEKQDYINFSKKSKS